MEAKMTHESAPEMALWRVLKCPKTLCVPYVSARNGQWQGPQKGAKKGPRKGAKKEPGMKPEREQKLELH